MKSAAEQLQQHLEEVLLPDESIESLTNIARMIWCTKSPLPKELQALRLDRETIAESFARWSAVHRGRECEYAQPSFWESRIKETLKSETHFDGMEVVKWYEERLLRLKLKPQ